MIADSSTSVYILKMSAKHEQYSKEWMNPSFGLESFGQKRIPDAFPSIISMFSDVAPRQSPQQPVASAQLAALEPGAPAQWPPVQSGPSAQLPVQNVSPQPLAVLWHERYGHLAYSSLMRLASHSMVHDFAEPAMFRNVGSALCDPCMDSKQVRASHPQSGQHATSVCDLIHMDICGPIATKGIGGMSYFATFLDDCSGLSIVRPVRTKGDVVPLVRDVLQLFETQSGKSVRAVRTDRGSEYFSGTVQNFLASKGILHQASARYTPEQNGRAERLNRTLLERVRAMLSKSGVQKSLWPEALLTANYLRNRSPVSHSSVTPFEAFFGVKPSVSHLRVWGCVVSVKSPSVEVPTKLHPVSTRGIFVGYEATSANFRVYLPTKRKVVISPDVRFFESLAGSTLTASSDPPESALPTVELPLHSEAVPSAPVLPPSPPSVSPSVRSPPPRSIGSAERVESVSPPDSEVYSTPLAPNALDLFESSTEGGGSVPRSVPGLSESAATLPVPPATVRRSERVRNPPARLVFMAHSSPELVEPQSYAEAISSPQSSEWIRAMNEEMSSLLENNTWSLEPVPPGFKPLPVKWVYKIKRGADGQIQRFKARLVVKGFRQVEGLDYNEVYAPVAKHTTLRVLLSLVAELDMELDHLDVKTAFLNGILEETVYMQQP